MIEECNKQYPALKGEIDDLEKKPGIVAYLFNTLIDFETLGYRGKDTNTPGTGGLPIPADGHGKGTSETDALMYCTSP